MRDASAFVGPWAAADTRARTLDELVTDLRAVGIDGAAISPLEAVTHPEPMAANRRLLDTIARRPVDSFVIVAAPIIDPSLPAWPEHLATCCALGGPAVRAVKIVPSYHGYALDPMRLQPFILALRERRLSLCVQLRMIDERALPHWMTVESMPAEQVAGLARASPQLPILACGAYLGELAAFQPTPKVSAELSFVESGRLLRDALQALDGDRLLIGTHAPLHYAAAGAAKAVADDLDDVTYHQVRVGNFQRLFGE